MTRNAPRPEDSAAPRGTFVLSAPLGGGAALAVMTVLFFHQVIARRHDVRRRPTPRAPVGFVRMGEQSL